MGLTGIAVFGVSVMMFTLALNAIGGWTLDTDCPGSPAFCDGVFWRAVVEYLPTWLYVAHILVVLVLSSPVALLRVGR